MRESGPTIAIIGAGSIGTAFAIAFDTPFACRTPMRSGGLLRRVRSPPAC